MRLGGGGWGGGNNMQPPSWGGGGGGGAQTEKTFFPFLTSHILNCTIVCWYSTWFANNMLPLIADLIWNRVDIL